VPIVEQWRVWYARFSALIDRHTTHEDKAGTWAQRLKWEGESLWTFLDVKGVEATNNMAERSPMRCDVVHKKPGHVERKG